MRAHAALLLLPALLLGSLMGACGVETFPQEALFSCAGDGDCEERYTCAPYPGGGRFCCLAATEVCDGQDNDCNGEVDELPPHPCYSGPAATRGVGACHDGAPVCSGEAERCEGETLPSAERCDSVDEDCDGQVDEDFDLRTDPRHCGACDQGCDATQRCLEGHCTPLHEAHCADGRDEDVDGAADCADPDCEEAVCGVGCVCAGGARREARCGDAVDNDGDGSTDCQDSDCDLQACVRPNGSPGVCSFDLRKCG
jgi:Putative metal-binding motif